MTANETLQLIAQHWCNLNDLMKLAGVGRNSALKIKNQIKTSLHYVIILMVVNYKYFHYGKHQIMVKHHSR